MDSLWKVWVNLWTPLSWPFTVAVIIMMVWDLASHYVNEGKGHRQFTGLMTGAGILGTFFGVLIGLQDFDPNNIGASIGPLLEGLKGSFATSVAGIFAAIATEGIETAFPSKRGRTGDPVADSLNHHLLDLTELMESSKKANLFVAENVAGLRTEMRDESAKVRQALEVALAELARGASEEIIRALERVIEDFNTNLKEQFGENFKRLNEACLKMVEWQESYEHAVTACNQALVDASAAMRDAREQFEAAAPQKQRFYEIVLSTGQTLEIMVKLNQRLQDLSGTLGKVLDQFGETLSGVEARASSMENTFSNALTTVSNQHSDVMDGFKSLAQSADQSRSRIEVMLGEHARGHKQVADSIEDVVKRLANGGKELNGHLDKSLNELEGALASLTREFGAAYRNYLDGLRRFTNDRQ